MLSPLRTRLAVGVLLGLALCLWPAAWRVAAPALSPYLAVCGAFTVRSVTLLSLLAAPMLAVAILRRRFWCRHLCPVGLISEACGKLRRYRAAAASLTFSFPPARVLALATLGGALVGYPLFLWMDPLALFSGFFSVTRIARPEISVLSVIGLPLVMLISFLLPGTWCSQICPLGGTQDLLALAFSRRAPNNGFQARRAFLSLGAGVAFSALVPRAWAKKRSLLRPPGSVDETAFLGGCIRCGSCSRACPTGIIEPAIERGDVAGFLAPRLRFSGADYCLQSCNLCGRVCPTGVIRPLALEAKNRQVIGIASIDLDRCFLTEERECGVCIPRCPRAALVDGFSRETYKVTVEVLRDRCNGCGACVGICPPKVITIVPPPRRA